jgi:uncharacterized membrane protein YccC
MDEAILPRAAADLASDVRDPRWNSMHGGLHVLRIRRRVLRMWRLMLDAHAMNLKEVV